MVVSKLLYMITRVVEEKQKLQMMISPGLSAKPARNQKNMVHTLSYDEKPGVQAIKVTGEDRPPVPGTDKYTCVLTVRKQNR